MRQMKDSGIEWIGNIPATWKINTVFQLFTQVKNKNTDLQEQNLLSLSYGKIKRRSIDTTDGLLPESFDGYNIIEADDIVLRLTDLQNDHKSLRVGLATERGIVTSAYLTIRNRSESLAKYLYYYLHSFDIAKGFYGMGAGVRQGLNWDGMKWLKILTPPVPEQQRIIAFLDSECDRIDAVIKQTRTSIEEYKKLKQAIITQAVTKGIRPNRPMKDSGIDGIGEIPVSWDMVKLKYFLSTDKVNLRVGPFGSALSGTDFTSDGVWVYNQRVVLDNNFSENNTFVSEEKYEELKGFEVLPDDVLITTRGSIGKVAIVPTTAEKGILHPCVIKFRVNKDLITHTLIWHIFNNTDIAMRQIKDMSNSTTIEVLYSYSLRNVQIPLIPKDEWKEIEQFIEKTADEYDRLIDYKNQLLMELESYKRALIFECVTGKKEVV